MVAYDYCPNWTMFTGEKKLIYDIIRGGTQLSYMLLIKYIPNSSVDSTHLL